MEAQRGAGIISFRFSTVVLLDERPITALTTVKLKYT